MTGQHPPGSPDAPADSGATLTVLDQAVWRRLGAGTGDDELDLDAWLTLQCGMIEGAACGVLVLGDADVGPFKAVAQWPAGRSVSPLLSSAAELAVTQRRGVVQGQSSEGAPLAPGAASYGVAYPVMAGGRVHGVVAVETLGLEEGDLRGAMRQLQWGAAWIELLLSRRQIRSDAGRQERIATALDLIADALEESAFDAAALAVVSELAAKLDCERVSLGFTNRDQIRVASISNTARFDEQMNLVRQIAAAMNEASDQRTTVVYPPQEETSVVTRCHADFARDTGAGSVVTVPLFVRSSYFGALTLEFGEGRRIDPGLVELCETIAAVVGPILYEKHLNDRPLIAKVGMAAEEQLSRLLGPRYFGRKLTAIVSMLILGFFAVVTADYRVAADAVLEGEIQRVIAAPMDGYVREAQARAGDRVTAGQTVASLYDEELILNRHRWVAERRQKMLEYDRAMARGQAADTRIAKAQMDQAQAQIELLDQQIARVTLEAPFDGLVISGDLSQSIGKPVRQGETLFEIAPLDSYRVVLKVDEADIDELALAQEGGMLIVSMPEERFGFVVEKVTPVSVVEEGRNYFRVEARLTGETERLRPGMAGVGKVNVGARRLIWIWTHNLSDWLRLKLWAWWP